MSNMKPSQVKRALAILIKLRRPCVLWGAPGIGKSQLVHQVCQELVLQMIDLRTSLLDPVDMRGVPSVRDGITYWNAPCFLPTSGEGVLFLDELGHAEKSVQASCLQLLQERRLGEYKLPDGWSVVAATNRSEDRAGCGRFISPLNNRFIHIDVEVDKDDWRSWACQSGIDSQVRAFIDFRPSLLHNHDPKQNERAFPTPRSWSYVSELLPALKTDDLLLPLLEGTVGKAAAAEMTAFLKTWSGLPKLADILNDPKGVKVDLNDAGICYALVGLMTDALKNAKDSEYPAMIAFMSRLPAEYAVLLVRDWIVVKKDFVNHKALLPWILKNKDILQGKMS
jgi:hypothetical protein